MTTWKAVATMEFDEAPPETIRETYDAKEAQTVALRAIKALKKAHPGRKPRSWVVVVERLS